MLAKRRPGPLQRLFRLVATVALTAAGCILILLALSQHARRLPLPGVRRAAVAASSRGGRLGERPLVGGFEQAMAVGPSTNRARLQSRAVLSTTVGTELPPAPLPAPTEQPTPTPEPPRTEVVVYRVQPGDNLFLIAQQFKVSQDTVVWANPGLEKDPDQIQIGQELNILPVDGVWHTVKAGEGVNGIAKRYQVDAKAVTGYAPNGLAEGAGLKVGQKLIIPGGIKPPEYKPAPKSAPAPGAPTYANGRIMIPAGAPAVPVQAPAQPGRFVWPAQGVITQGYGKWHGAIDIANKQGTPIVAADAGTVTVAGTCGGLGNAIQIDHGDGFVTSYGHLYRIDVQVGQKVAKGEQIGLMGTTGHSTGPHLHLILTYNGGVINPLDFLPR